MTMHSPDLVSGVQPVLSASLTAHTPAPHSAYRRAFKRLFDVTLVLLSAPLVLPVVAIMALLVALDGRSPFYSQMRVGRKGRMFRMWKMRTMVHNADVLLEAYLASNPEARREWDSTQKLKTDPRITRIGSLLRKTSLDELPQLWNVLNGTMSLVGPRPMMTDQQRYYHGQSYYRMRPGITGLWQVSDRNHCDFVQRVDYDDLYDQTLSFKRDMQVLCQTVGVVVRATGY
ncbi:MAG: sugar transferase [Paracoccaceae bacterium]